MYELMVMQNQIKYLLHLERLHLLLATKKKLKAWLTLINLRYLWLFKTKKVSLINTDIS